MLNYYTVIESIQISGHEVESFLEGNYRMRGLLA